MMRLKARRIRNSSKFIVFEREGAYCVFYREISTNKRLFEMAKRQTEEIELLREELTRLKSKTFANFSNVA